MIHELKLYKEYFDDVASGVKKFEFRYNDRNYQVGDELLLKEWDTDRNTYTGRKVAVKVTYILSLDYFFKRSVYHIPNPFANYVVLSIELLNK
jgi:ASC-1-like (ASCH) protein